jgi:hypothetical protein
VILKFLFIPMRILLSIGFKSWVNKSWHILHFTIGGCNPHDEASDTDSCEPLVPLKHAAPLFQHFMYKNFYKFQSLLFRLSDITRLYCNCLLNLHKLRILQIYTKN